MSIKLTGPMVMPEETPAKRIVVLLHGYGSDGNDLIALVPYLKDLLPDALFVAPHAPMSCDINPSGFQWFPLDLDRDFSRLNGAEMARPVINEFLTDLWAETGLSAADTLLCGFSQGAMMALDVGLRQPDPLLGIVAFSGGLIQPDTIGETLASKPPVCLIHGEADDVVPVEMSRASATALQALGLDVSLYVSPGQGHTIPPDGLEAARTFIARVA